MKIFSFPPIYSPKSKVLILGTMPGKKSLELNQYYGHGGNQFWNIMFSLFEMPLSKDYDDRKQVLLDNNIALWDVLKACVRESSADSDILSEEPNDFDSLIQNSTGINTIFFNGKNAKEYFDRYISIEIDNQYVLPSTSPANTWKTFDQKVDLWRTILKHI